MIKIFTIYLQTYQTQFTTSEEITGAQEKELETFNEKINDFLKANEGSTVTPLQSSGENFTQLTVVVEY